MQEFTITTYTSDMFTDTEVFAALGGLSSQQYFGCGEEIGNLLWYVLRTCHPGTGQGRPIRHLHLWGPLAQYTDQIKEVMVVLVKDYWVREKGRVAAKKAAFKAWKKAEAAKE